VSINGNLRTMPFADLLQWVAQSRKTGTLVIEGEPYTKKIFFKEGTIAGVASENPTEYLGYYMVGWGHVEENELEELLDMQERYGTLLGELLVMIGRLSREELNGVLQVKTEESIFELFQRDEGAFRFLDNVLPKKKFEPLGLAVDGFVLEGMRRRDEWQRIREVIPDPTFVPKLIRAVDVQQMGPPELAILRELNGRNSIVEIALACRVAPFFVLEFVYHGVVNGLFAIAPPALDKEVRTPDLSVGSWRNLLKDAEKAYYDGELLDAYRKVMELTQKHGRQRQAQELARDLEQKIEQRVAAHDLKDEIVLELAITPEELTRLECDPAEGFLLSRLNGLYTLGQIITTVPGSPTEVRLMVEKLIARGVARVKGP
jgi:hypothetical protein